ncbi:ankyrin repeat domain-containing protein SOWAHB-like [Pygocentrus nattereri]|uniref:ankyrin repeat domain-containing protein SOWAHB-like n=1 Tax=Pygocentrus nattereri TaxID=42514 RepID=UPI000814498F|nr:ankyrin repeat domain-containing protein SOWAHB-like [Pygocentrus nattereri]
MEISQEAILRALTEAGGQVKNSELLARFKAPLNCSDPAEKKQNRYLFKTFVNNIAVVKENEEVKYIALKKKYHHLLTQSGDGSAQDRECEEGQLEKAGQHPAGEENREGSRAEGEEAKAPGPNKPEEQVQPDKEDDTPNNSQPLCPIELAFERIKSVDVKAKRYLQFVVPLKSSADDTQQLGPRKSQASTNKPCALPLRMPPVVITPCPEVNTTKEHLAPSRSRLEPPSSPRYKRRPSTDSMAGASSPQTRRHCKSIRPVDELKYGDMFPLETTEHEWLVSSAVGHWGLLYGHLLNDTQLAEKRDFVSGFTALHWAAKCGNSDMVCKLIELSKEKGKGVDVNSKSFAGYTPLHIAALHDQEYIMKLLVQRYGADPNVRDNCGKKPHHYLHRGVSVELRELLGAPKVKAQGPEPQKSAEEPEAHRHSHTISRLFQPHTIGYKKKPKIRGSFLSVAEEGRDERDEHPSPMHRVLSDVFS